MDQAVSPTRETVSLSIPRPEIWAEVPDEKWNDWRWQLSHRLNTLDELRQVIHLTLEEEKGVKAQHRFRLDISHTQLINLILDQALKRYGLQ